jgi:hypothetical protein
MKPLDGGYECPEWFYAVVKPGIQMKPNVNQTAFLLTKCPETVDHYILVLPCSPAANLVSTTYSQIRSEKLIIMPYCNAT